MAVEIVKAPKSSMDSTFPVLLPAISTTFLSDDAFSKRIHELLSSSFTNSTGTEGAIAELDLDRADEPTKVTPRSLSSEIHSLSTFMEALATATLTPKRDSLDTSADNRMFTENHGIAHISTRSSLLDLFSELEKTLSGERLQELLEAAWQEDSLTTLKIIWNARSIHLGKAEQDSFYRCIGWMKSQHPETILTNLPWLYRPTIEKKVKVADDDAAVLIERDEKSDEDFIMQYGVSHGYWKDLLNILVLAVNGSLEVLADVRQVLHAKNCQAGVSGEQAKARKHELERTRHEKVLKMLRTPFYHALHSTVSRHFAQQLRKDMDLLASGTSQDLKEISLAAKWAPSLESFHDKHTFVVSSIAEALFPQEKFGEPDDSRELYLRRARELYRRLTLSPLRKALEVVERDVSAETFKNINYAKVPSVAMDNYKDLFAEKDFEGFEKYINRVAEGKSRISGAVLMPGNLVHQAREAATGKPAKRSAKRMLQTRTAEILGKTLDGQWEALVQRIKDNGKLTSSIAVCDVSFSMTSPTFPDGTTPIDTAVGLSLLLAEVTQPPFGGTFIGFSETPQVYAVGGPDDKRSFQQKVDYILQSQWGMSTDFTAVFERLILPMAIKHGLKQADMVKQVFVFSDMQFNSAQAGSLETAYERIRRKYAAAGYEMPTLVFWNLAGGRAGYNNNNNGYGDPVAPKPVEKDTQGTMLVGGYSQGMMKMFLDNGQFGDEGEDEEEEVSEEVVGEGEDGQEGLVEIKTKKRKVDPMAGMFKAIGHPAYSMLKVVD
ncbi:hypothetical protein MMC19_003941 [Ptychographa xylographoides]|nr:hypothetical protein [Ptychographa xylographoides]